MASSTPLESLLENLTVGRGDNPSLYKPLDINKDEIRLISITPQSKVDGLNDGQAFRPNLVHCSMETVSLDAFTTESKEFLEEEETEICLGIAFWNKKRKPRPERHQDVPKGTRAETRAAYTEFTAEQAFYEPSLVGTSWNRWIWGDYAALSYTWGDPKVTRDIVLNGRIVKVTNNLEAFLRLWAQSAEVNKDNGLKMWIDALCINQEDTKERNWHIENMSAIYACALCNRAWLGPERDESNLAMSVLDEMGNCVGNEFGSEFLAMRDALRKDPTYFQRGSWRALEAFLSRPYWTRLWIIQEMALNFRNTFVICGDQAISWWRLIQAIMVLASDLSNSSMRLFQDYRDLELKLSSDVGLSDQISRLQLLSEACYRIFAPLTGPDLSRIIYNSRMSEQFEDRDKIYAILAMLDMKEFGSSITKRVTVDYNREVLEVFADFTTAVIEGTGSLDVLCTARAQNLDDKTI